MRSVNVLLTYLFTYYQVGLRLEGSLISLLATDQHYYCASNVFCYVLSLLLHGPCHSMAEIN